MKAPDSKSGKWAIPASGVRIPPSPPDKEGEWKNRKTQKTLLIRIVL